jgi:hypothetical protein
VGWGDGKGNQAAFLRGEASGGVLMCVRVCECVRVCACTLSGYHITHGHGCTSCTEVRQEGVGDGVRMDQKPLHLEVVGVRLGDSWRQAKDEDSAGCSGVPSGGFEQSDSMCRYC